MNFGSKPLTILPLKPILTKPTEVDILKLVYFSLSGSKLETTFSWCGAWKQVIYLEKLCRKKLTL